MITALVDVRALESEFVEALESGVQSFAAAGKILVKMMDADKDVVERLRETRNIPASLLRSLEKIGRGTMLPEMFTEPALARLPLSEQKQIVRGDVDMLTFDAEGEPTTLKVNLLLASADVRGQVVNGTHIRSLAEQRAYLASINNRNQPSEKSEPPSWRVVGRVVRVRSGVDLTQGDLITMQKALLA